MQPTDISKSKRHPEEVSLERDFLRLYSFPAINSIMRFAAPFMHQKCNHLSEMKDVIFKLLRNSAFGLMHGMLLILPLQT